MKSVRVYFLDGEISTYLNAFIYAYSDRVLVVKEDSGAKHVIPHQSYSLASEITVEK